MKRQIAALGLFVFALVTPGCNQAPPPAPDTREADAKAIRDNEESWNKDYVTKDASKLILHYTNDATLMGPGMPASHGKLAIEKVLKEMVSDPALTLKFTPSRIEVARSGDIAFTEGSYTMTMTNPATKKPMTDKGSYVTVYQKAPDGSWKAASDIATSEAPPMPPPDKK